MIIDKKAKCQTQTNCQWSVKNSEIGIYVKTVAFNLKSRRGLGNAELEL